MKKVAIVGAHYETRDDAPYSDVEYEIWGISRYARAPWMLRCDAVIEIHKGPVYMFHPEDRHYWQWLQETDLPVYMLSGHTDIKNARPYPLQSMRRELLSNIRVHGEPITNLGDSIDFALALAIYQEYDVIDIYGVEMGKDTKYVTQRPGFAFWTGLAAGRGITVNINCTSDLFKTHIYGRWMVDVDEHLAFLKIEREV
jgi:hypothetical protein